MEKKTIQTGVLAYRGKSFPAYINIENFIIQNVFIENKEYDKTLYDIILYSGNSRYDHSINLKNPLLPYTPNTSNYLYILKHHDDKARVYSFNLVLYDKKNGQKIENENFLFIIKFNVGYELPDYRGRKFLHNDYITSVSNNLIYNQNNPIELNTIKIKIPEILCNYKDTKKYPGFVSFFITQVFDENPLRCTIDDANRRDEYQLSSAHLISDYDHIHLELINEDGSEDRELIIKGKPTLVFGALFYNNHYFICYIAFDKMFGLPEEGDNPFEYDCNVKYEDLFE